MAITHADSKTDNVIPDIAIFGKALGNGYAITSIIGREEVMESAQTSFISSTFWSERIGPTAALKTLEVMEKLKSWEIITNTGLMVRDRWIELSKKYDLNIDIFGLPSLSGFSFKSNHSLEYKTLISQEMLKLGYLAGTSLYTCIDHSNEVIDNYINALESIFSIISECEKGKDIESMLDGPVCHDGFKRLN